MTTSQKPEIFGALVWIASAMVIFVYVLFAWLGFSVPGVEQLVSTLAEVEGAYVYAAAFVAMLIEGLYFFGSFFPGSTLVVLIAILAQSGGLVSFLLTIAAIFFGWLLAGLVNILWAKIFFTQVINDRMVIKPVQDRPWTTWFPAFRANYEVAQVVEGAPWYRVFMSSARVKAWASLAAALYAFVASRMVDVSTISNEEGFVSLAVVALVTLIVGCVKWRNAYNARKLSQSKY